MDHHVLIPAGVAGFVAPRRRLLRDEESARPWPPTLDPWITMISGITMKSGWKVSRKGPCLESEPLRSQIWRLGRLCCVVNGDMES